MGKMTIGEHVYINTRNMSFRTHKSPNLNLGNHADSDLNWTVYTHTYMYVESYKYMYRKSFTQVDADTMLVNLMFW